MESRNTSRFKILFIIFHLLSGACEVENRNTYSFIIFQDLKIYLLILIIFILFIFFIFIFIFIYSLFYSFFIYYCFLFYCIIIFYCRHIYLFIFLILTLFERNWMLILTLSFTSLTHFQNPIPSFFLHHFDFSNNWKLSGSQRRSRIKNLIH